ncbi:hypothetical protein DB32_003017 [Sandaracinus amylolyticus]|uniref:Tetratricopeptide repeat protein n=1 Tax=Sandaracinus amylolyticus TaxID=927083 RepID=A0A0F6W2J9_9BACT|nr:hypothetical protein DB32_003017 [Sandaracinus amylolyticus]
MQPLRAGWAEARDARTGLHVRIAYPDGSCIHDPQPLGRDRLAFDRRAHVRRLQVAEVAARLASPAFLRVLATDPLVVEATPPTSTLGASDAIECLLQLLEVLGRIHAAGWAHRCLIPAHVGVERRDDRVQVRVAFPAVGPFAPHEDAAAERAIGPIRTDLLQAARLARIWVGDFDAPRVEVARLSRALGHVASAAQLARVLAPDHWRARAAVIPDVVELRPMPTDWTRVIASLEADLAAPVHASREEYARYPLAFALDQRARIALDEGDLERALRDADRAVELDDEPSQRLTRAVVRLELGDLEGALVDAKRALAPPSVPVDWIGEVPLLLAPARIELSPAALARAHLVLARVHQERGDHAAARDAIARARACSDEPIVTAIERPSR